MKKNLFLRLCLMMVVMLSFYCCRNEDLTNQDDHPKRNNADFFKHSKKGGLYAKTGIDYITILEAYNEEHNFLSTMPDREGMPIWEKMRIAVGETSTALTIPLSTDSETLSSILFAIIDKDGLHVNGINNITNDELKRVVYNTIIDAEKRESLFLTFMTADNYTFGNEVFTNIPQDLFVGDKMGAKNNQLYFHAPSVQETDITEYTDAHGKLTIVQEYVCAIVRHCTKHGGGACDNCGLCQTQSCSHSTVFIYSYPDPETGIVIYGYPDEGGGGGTPTSIPDPDPCGMTKAFYRVAPGCNGNTTPPELLDDPCEKTKAILARPEVQTKLDSLKKKSLSKGEIGFKTKKDGTVTSYINGGKHAVDLGVKVGFQGGYHNHTSTGISMHSPPDIDNNLLAFARAQPTGEHKNAYFGMIVKKVCTGCPGGFKIYNYIMRFDGEYNDALTNFSQLDIDKLNTEYSIKESKLSDPTGSYGSTYIDSAGNLTNEGLEVLFFDTVKKMGLTNKIILQRIEDDVDGTVNNITLNPDGLHTTANPCI